jgi:sugar O-acyltransferase (sialic acid O-acetyltransferase NeuD family)
MKIPDRRVWLIGGGGHAKVVLATFQACGWEVPGIFDSNPETWGSALFDVEIVGQIPESHWWHSPDICGFLSIGSNTSRARLATMLKSARWGTVIHPSATVHASVYLGPGTLVCAHAVVQPDARIGAHTSVNTGAVVEHDNRIGDFCHIGPRACLAGSVSVGDGVFVGAGATVTPGIHLGAWSTIGAGAAVIEDIPEAVTAVGVPAHCLLGPRSTRDAFRGGRRVKDRVGARV